MKSKYRNLLVAGAIATALGTSGVVVADSGGYRGDCQRGGHAMQGHGGMGMHGKGMKGGIGFGLDLSDEQKAEMGKIRQEFLPQIGELRGRIQATQEQLRMQRHSDTVDQTAIANLADRKGDLIAEMIKLRSRQKARMQAVLTDEQREQMRQRHQNRGNKGMRQMES